MARNAALALMLALLPGCGGGAEASAPAAAADVRDPRAWEIGPIIRRRNYSEGVPLHPTPRRSGGWWHIDLPPSPGSVHYVTFRHGSLAGKKRLVLRYRVEAAPGVRILPITEPSQASIITLYFERAGDTWSAKRQYESYRWYATFASHSPIQPGAHEIIAPLDANWTAVKTSNARTNQVGFRQAVANADRVGFVLGGGTGYGHGVFATGRARIVVTDFRVE